MNNNDREILDMTSHHYTRMDVFTDQPLTGNQLAVFLDGAGLEAGLMQRIANELALPETTFVMAPGSPESAFRVRIFTPERELPMAGHPTVGTAFALARAGRIDAGSERTVFELGIGPTPVQLEWEAGRLRTAWMSQSPPQFGERLEDPTLMAAALGLDANDMAAPEYPVQVVSAGVPFLFAPLGSRAAVDRAVLDRSRLVEACRALGDGELPVYLFTLEPGADGATTYSRMFAPVFGIAEDPATGGASGPLAAYLVHYGAVTAQEAKEMVNLQGVKMQRPSEIRMSVHPDDPNGPVLVGGHAVTVGEGNIHFAAARDDPAGNGSAQR